MVGDNTQRASRINSITDRYTRNIANQRPYRQEAERAARLFDNNRANAAAIVTRNAMNRQYTRNQYMSNSNG